jgi:hypothetical protein
VCACALTMAPTEQHHFISLSLLRMCFTLSRSGHCPSSPWSTSRVAAVSSLHTRSPSKATLRSHTWRDAGTCCPTCLGQGCLLLVRTASYRSCLPLFKRDDVMFCWLRTLPNVHRTGLPPSTRCTLPASSNAFHLQNVSKTDTDLLLQATLHACALVLILMSCTDVLLQATLHACALVLILMSCTDILLQATLHACALVLILMSCTDVLLHANDVCVCVCVCVCQV